MVAEDVADAVESFERAEAESSNTESVLDKEEDLRDVDGGGREAAAAG
jgi:hypothetical protein